MKNEIERKFLVKKVPDLKGLEPILYERYFLLRNDLIEIRIQKKGSKYEFERKEKQNTLCAKKQKFEISEKEFNRLKSGSKEEIIRTSYIIQLDPEISLKIYDGQFQGFMRLEVEFDDEESAENYKIPKWFGKEITGTKLGKDSKLIDLSQEEFKRLLK